MNVTNEQLTTLCEECQRKLRPKPTRPGRPRKLDWPEIRAAHEAGMSMREIAVDCGCSRAAVHGALVRMGLHRPTVIV